jgi:hypothetical protein
MQNIPKLEDNFIDSIRSFKYKNLLFRTMLQKFFEDFLPELKYVYGYGKLQLGLQDSFSIYIKNCLVRIEKMIEENDLNVINLDSNSLKSKISHLKNNIKFFPEENIYGNNKEANTKEKELIIDETSSNDKIDLEKFYREYLKYEKILWAFYVIRIKFAKIIEYIIALDRIIFLKENNIENVELVKIFDENKSARNLLIYASKLD